MIIWRDKMPKKKKLKNNIEQLKELRTQLFDYTHKLKADDFEYMLDLIISSLEELENDTDKIKKFINY